MEDNMKIQKSNVKLGGGTSPAPHTHIHTHKYISSTQKHQKKLKNIEVHVVYVTDFEGEFSNEILTHF